MRTTLRVVFGFLIAAMIVGVPMVYATYCQSQIRNFHVVREGVLYRSGQMSLAGLQRTVHDYNIKTVVTLRDSADPKDPPPDHDEEVYCRAAGITYVRISPRVWWSPNGLPPAEKGVRRFREIMDNPANYPVLVHCFAGVHRSGAFCAVYRMEYEHWSNAEAMAELRSGGYSHLDDEWDLLNYLEEYQPRWKHSDRAAREKSRQAKAVYKLVKESKSRRKK
jgi:tyrosine-protein phosphatase SIW14